MDEVIACDEAIGNCPVCASACSGYSADLVRCRGCRTTYRARRPRREAISEWYARGVHYSNWATQKEARERLWVTRANLVQQFRAGGALLDVGTGDGAFAALMAQRGFDVVATEVSSRGVELATARGVKVFQGELDSVRLPHASFDVISLWHVVEHVRDPLHLMRQVRGLLAPGGIIVVAVPNELREIYAARLNPSHRVGLLTCDEYELHLTYFTPRTLRSLLARAGLAEIHFGVDDVTIHPNTLTTAAARVNSWLARIAGLHLARAMFFVCRRGDDA